jgi:prenyltransferase beta subunit
MPRASFRLEMLQVARLAPKLLGESAELVTAFIRSQLSPQGGFVNREGRPDLYYTVFAIEALQALRVELPREQIVPWLRTFGTGEGLDLVHLCSLARSAAALGGEIFSGEERAKMATHLAAFRSADGGCHASRGSKAGSSYGALLLWGAHDDLGVPLPEENRLLQSVLALELEDGSFANEPGLTQGVSTATAAAVTLCRLMNHKLSGRTAEWLQQCFFPGGGFLVFPGVPMPDLLSTAVVLHALDGMEINFTALREPSLDFVDSLWSAQGGFHGNWTDDDLDCEYTYYGLLALGHLAL